MRRPSGPRVRYGTRPGPQSIRGTKPIDTAPTVAVPIMVKMTRRERFMRSPALTFERVFGQTKPWHSRRGIEAELRSAGKPKPAVSQDRAGRGPGGFVVSRRRKNGQGKRSQTGPIRPGAP